MQRLSVILSHFNHYVQNRTLKYIIWIRLLLGLVFFEILCEHFVDSSYIAFSSRTFNTITPEAGELRRILSNFILSSESSYNLFLLASMGLTLIYVSGLGGVWALWLFLAASWLFQYINIANLYAHEYTIHPFLVLLVFIELGQGRLKVNKFAPVRWQPSTVSGLSIFLIKWQFFMVYFMAGLGKFLSPEWKNDDVIERIFLNNYYAPSFFDFVIKDYKELSPFLIAAVEAFLMCFPLAMLVRRFRKPAFFLGVLFHATVALKIGLYGFSSLMVSLYLLFWDRSDRGP